MTSSEVDARLSTADRLLSNACRELGFDPREVFADLKKDRSVGYRRTIIRHVFSLTDRPEEHSRLAGAIVMWRQYLGSPTTISGYLKIFEPYLREDVIAFMREHEAILQAEVEKRFQNDFRMHFFSAGTLIETYLARVSYEHDPQEIPQFCWLRIAVGEFQSRGLPEVLRIYRRFSDRECVPASPTIFNMGFKEGASSSCMIYAVGDSLKDILSVMKEGGMASKNNAGLGIDLSGLRHSNIGRHGMSKGITPLMKIWDDLTIYINQGGRRPGAATISTRVHHYDTMEFVQMVDKVREDKVTKINTSIMLSDLFMKRCLEGGKWSLFCPKQTHPLNLLHGKEFEKLYVEFEEKARVWKRYQKYQELKKLIALQEETEFEEERLKEIGKKSSYDTVFDRFQTEKGRDFSSLYQELRNEFEGKPAPQRVDSKEYEADAIMDMICDMQIKTGMPYIVHGCNTNRKNNMANVGPVRSMNLCQEVTIPAVPGEQTGCCNLSSVSLPAFVRHPEGKPAYFDFLAFGQCVQDLVLCLNQVIDETKNVSKKVIKSNQLSRPIGIGVSGFADMCHELDLPPVDTESLPHFVGYDHEGNIIYRYESYSTEAQPAYTEDALKERSINPVLAEHNYKLWCCMYYNALYRSKEEAKVHGAYPLFSTSPTAQGRLQFHLWQEEEKETGRTYPFKLQPLEPSSWGQEGSWAELIEEIKKYGLRNALLLTCMPTASSAQILGNCESIEFHMQNIYSRKVLSGDYPVVNFHMVRDLQRIGVWSKETYNNIIANNGSILQIPETGLAPSQVKRLRFLKEKYLTMWELPQRISAELAAQRQVFIDQSQSWNVYIARPTKDLLKALHTFTWELGLKTGMYYLRSRSPNEALRIGQKTPEVEQKRVGEQVDRGLVEIQELIREAQKTKQALLDRERDEVIEEALMSAGRPQEICQLGANGECIGCQ